jgi:hypothetical protein
VQVLRSELNDRIRDRVDKRGRGTGATNGGGPSKQCSDQGLRLIALDFARVFEQLWADDAPRFVRR